MIYKLHFRKIITSALVTVLVSALVLNAALFLYTPFGALPGLSAETIDASMPQWVKNVLCLLPGLDLTDLTAYVLRWSKLLYAVLCAVFAGFGAGLVKRQEKTGLAEFALSRSVTRGKYVRQLWLVLLTKAVLTAAALWGLSLGFLALGGIDCSAIWGTFLYVWLRCGLVWLTLGTVGLGFGTLCKSAGAAKWLTLLVWLLLIACGVVPVFVPHLAFLTYGAMYHGAIPEMVTASGFFTSPWLLLTAGMLLIAGGLTAYFAMKRRDFPEVSEE